MDNIDPKMHTFVNYHEARMKDELVTQKRDEYPVEVIKAVLERAERPGVCDRVLGWGSKLENIHEPGGFRTVRIMDEEDGFVAEHYTDFLEWQFSMYDWLKGKRQPELERKEEAFVAYLKELDPSIGDPREQVPNWSEVWDKLNYTGRAHHVISDYFDREMKAENESQQ